MPATSLDLSQIKTDALSTASSFRSLIGLGTLATQSANIADYLTIASAASTYQPLDSDLTSIAALSTTAFGRSLLTEASATTARSTLGLGTLATQSPTGTPSASTFLRGDFSWQTIDLSGYVPYSGATGAVNLGANALTASRATLATGTITASTPAIDITQTWNNAATTFTGILANVTDTASNASSLLMDLQVGGSSRFGIRKSNYRMEIGADGNGPLLINMNNGNIGFTGNLTGVYGSFGSFGLSVGGAQGGAGASHLASDAANTLAQRNSTNAQTFRIYNTFTDASNYERAKIAWESNVLVIGTEAAGTGIGRDIRIRTNSGNSLTLSNGGELTMNSSLWLSWSSRVILESPGFGILRISDSNRTGFERLQLGGTTSSFPAIKRNAAALNFRLADDSAGCDITAAHGTFSAGTDTVSNPILNLSQTWNNAATTFTGILANVTDTASNAASLLMDLQVGGTSRFSVRKDGSYSVPLAAQAIFGAVSPYGMWQGFNGSLYFGTPPSTTHLAMDANGFYLRSTGGLRWSTSATDPYATGLALFADANDTLAQRRSTNPQVHRIYNTFTDASNYERGKIEWSSNVLRIGTEKAGTGSARALELQTDGVTRLTIASTGAVTFSGNVSMPASSQLSWGAFTILQAFLGHTYLDSPTSGEIYLRPGGGTIRLTANATGVAITGQLSISAINLVTDTTTGTKIGTATTQKLGFYNATPVVQPTAVADATDAASVITQLNALLSRMRDLGLIAT